MSGRRRRKASVKKYGAADNVEDSSTVSKRICTNSIEELPEHKDSSSDCTFTIDCLLRPLLLQILTYIPLRQRVGLSLVSKFWHGLVFDQALWQQIDLLGYPLRDSHLLRLTSLSKNVTHMNFSSVHVTPRGFRSVLQQCQNLIDLKLSSISFLAPLDAVGKCHHIRHLKLDRCPGLTDRALAAIAQGCPRLESLDLRYSFVSALTDDGIIAIANHCPQLNYLHLEHCFEIKGKFLDALTSGCPEIDSLGLLGCFEMTGHNLPLLGRLKKLQLLNLGRMFIKEPELIRMVKELRTVTALHLRMNYVTDKVAEAIAHYMPNAKKLEFCYYSRITDAGLVFIGKYLKELESLNVRGCDKLTEEAVRYVLAQCPKLSYFNLEECVQCRKETVLELTRQYPHIQFN